MAKQVAGMVKAITNNSWVRNMKHQRLLAIILFTALLAACGGEGGGKDHITPPPIVNTAPVASAGTDQSILTNAVVTLDGSKSSDANGDSLTYAWTLTAKPAGSAATLSSSTSAMPTFTADVAGTYVATLIVNDGKVNRSAASVNITVTATPVN